MNLSRGCMPQTPISKVTYVLHGGVPHGYKGIFGGVRDMYLGPLGWVEVVYLPPLNMNGIRSHALAKTCRWLVRLVGGLNGIVG